MKWCHSCKRILDTAAFFLSRNRADRLSATCRRCKAADQRRRRWQKSGIAETPERKIENGFWNLGYRTTHAAVIRKARACYSAASRLFTGAKHRANKTGVVFTLKHGDFTVPDMCPVLGIPLRPNTKKINDNSPTLDRIDNERGYTPDNVQVISYAANRMKSNASPEILRAFARWIKENVPA